MFWAGLSAAFAILTAVFAKLGDASHVTAIEKTRVVLAALFTPSFLGKRLSGLSWLGVLLVGAGAVAHSVGDSRGHRRCKRNGAPFRNSARPESAPNSSCTQQFYIQPAL